MHVCDSRKHEVCHVRMQAAHIFETDYTTETELLRIIYAHEMVDK